jgi:dihydroorotate dehydrogenase electron transfer subunit
MKAFRSSVDAVHYATEDGSKGTCGLVTDALGTFLDKPTNMRPVIYACGPHAMLAAVSRLAEDRGVDCQVSLEERMACGLGVCMGCSTAVRTGGYQRVCKEGPVFLSSEIDWKDGGALPVERRN